MATEKRKDSKSGKKEVRKQIATTLETSFPILKEGLGKKRLQRNIKKASKDLVDGFNVKTADRPENKTSGKKTVVKKAPAKKAAARPEKKGTLKS